MISVLFPTTGRPERAEHCVRQLRATTVGYQLEIVAVVDADEETDRRLGPLVDVLLYSHEYRGCSRAWNDALRACTGDPVVFAADDLVWTKRWLQAALTQLTRFDGGWGLVGFNDGHWGAELSTHYLMSRRFIVEVLGGVVAWDFYRHSFNDLEVNARAKAAGRYRWAESCYVPHEHWTLGSRAQDDTDRLTLAEHADSERAFKEREAAGFPTDYPPVITE